MSRGIRFEIEYTDELKTQMRGDSHSRPFDPYGRLAIYADGGEIAGPEEGYIIDYLGGLLEALLNSVTRVINGERSIERTPDENLYLVFEPRSETTLGVTICYSSETAANPEDRLEIEQPTVVRIDSFAEAAIETTKEFIETLLTLNPEIEIHPMVQEFYDDIDAAERALEEYRIRTGRNSDE